MVVASLTKDVSLDRIRILIMYFLILKVSCAPTTTSNEMELLSTTLSKVSSSVSISTSNPSNEVDASTAIFYSSSSSQSQSNNDTKEKEQGQVIELVKTGTAPLKCLECTYFEKNYNNKKDNDLCLHADKSMETTCHDMDVSCGKISGWNKEYGNTMARFCSDVKIENRDCEKGPRFPLQITHDPNPPNSQGSARKPVTESIKVFLEYHVCRCTGVSLCNNSTGVAASKASNPLQSISRNKPIFKWLFSILFNLLYFIKY